MWHAATLRTKLTFKPFSHCCMVYAHRRDETYRKIGVNVCVRAKLLFHYKCAVSGWCAFLFALLFKTTVRIITVVHSRMNGSVAAAEYTIARWLRRLALLIVSLSLPSMIISCVYAHRCICWFTNKVFFSIFCLSNFIQFMRMCVVYLCEENVLSSSILSCYFLFVTLFSSMNGYNNKLTSYVNDYVYFFYLFLFRS